jgi:3D (Asp-Asp-Asp) domain-containing protein
MFNQFPKTRAVLTRWTTHWSERAKATSINGIALLILVNMSAGAGFAMNAEAIQQEHALALSSIAKTNAMHAKRSLLPVIVTAYSSDEDQTDDSPFITASGALVGDGVIAANFLPFGTKVQIPTVFGNKVFTVKDRMHRRFSDRIDIWFNDRASAMKFGIKKAEIVVL